MNEIIPELEPLQFFDLPGFFTKFDEWYSTYGRSMETRYRTLNAIYDALSKISDAHRARIYSLYHQDYEKDTKRVLEYFYSTMVAPEWRADVEAHIHQIQQQYS